MHTLVEACVVIAAVQPSPMLNVHEIVSPWNGRSESNTHENPQCYRHPTRKYAKIGKGTGERSKAREGGLGLTETMPPP